jgi:hypothetical protein
MTSGEKLGPYEILSSLGKGGMGDKPPPEYCGTKDSVNFRICSVRDVFGGSMPNARMIPIVNLNPDQEISADQIVLVANGKLQVETEDGEKLGILLQPKDRPLLNEAVALGYLKYSGRPARLGEAFRCWCDAKKIACVSFEVENDRVDIPSPNDPLENVDPFVIMHFDVVTAGRPFTKAGLVAVTERLLGKLWNVALSPWKMSAGVLPMSQARQILADVHKIWDTTSEPKFQSRFSTCEWQESSASRTVQ